MKTTPFKAIWAEARKLFLHSSSYEGNVLMLRQKATIQFIETVFTKDINRIEYLNQLIQDDSPLQMTPEWGALKQSTKSRIKFLFLKATDQANAFEDLDSVYCERISGLNALSPSVSVGRKRTV